MMLPPRVSAIVFDCDGVLLDTESCCSRAEAALFAEDMLIGRSVPRHLDSYFEVSVTADDVAHAKPHPEPYLVAFERLGARPSDGVALADSSTGVVAAQAAGAFVIAVPSQAGKALTADFVTDALTDPEIVAWGRTVRELE